MKVQRRTFAGGYNFQRFEGEPVAQILPPSIPAHVTIPLKQGFGKEVIPLVKQGDVVKAGQLIGRDDDHVSSPIHASVNGAVTSVKRFEYFGEKVRCVVIQSDGTTTWQPLEGHGAQWRQLPVEKLEELVYRSGVTALGSSGIPTRYQSSIIAPAAVQHLIVQHAESDVFYEALPQIFQQERLEQFIEGLLILHAFLENAQVHIVLNRARAAWGFELEERLNNRCGHTLYVVPPKYPQHLDGVLLPTILKQKLPYGHLPAHRGVITLTVQDVLHVYEAVVQGKPLIERQLLLAGPGFAARPSLQVRIGTSVQEALGGKIKSDKEYRMVLNSLTTGRMLPALDTPLTKEYARLIAIEEQREGDLFGFMQPGFRFDSLTRTFAAYALQYVLPRKKLATNVNGEKRACLSCGFCNECCPAGLYPNLLHHYIAREKFDEPVVQFGIFDCINCNLCTYVCPSKLPVAAVIKYGKEKLVQEGFRPPFPAETYVDLKNLDEYRGLQ